MNWPTFCKRPVGVSAAVAFQKSKGGSMYVPDFRMIWLASVFKVQVSDLLPEIDWRAPVVETLRKYIAPEKLIPPAKLLLPVSFDSVQFTPDKKERRPHGIRIEG